LNPRWNTPTTPKEQDDLFEKASTLMGAEFTQALQEITFSWLPGREIVSLSLSTASNQIMILNQQCPWKDHLSNLEKELGLTQEKNQILFVIYEDGDGWRVQAVPKEEGGFESRLGLKEEWRGIRDEKLSELSGIDGCVFVHASGFIGGNKSKQGALQMAQQTISAAT